MSYNLPFPQRTQWDPSGQYSNPAATNPLPQPSNLPVGCWYGMSAPINWTATTRSGFNKEAIWRSPIYDLRPELRGMSTNGFSTNGTISTAVSDGAGYRQVTQGRIDNAKNAVPIWGGAGGHLLIQVSGLTSSATARNGIIVLTSESAHISDPARLVPIIADNDATFALETQTNSAILGFTATGENAPARFWQLTLTFLRQDNIPDATALPRYDIEAAFY